MQDQPLDKLSVIVPIGPRDSLPMRLRDQLARLPAAAEVLVVYAHSEARDEAASTRSSGPVWRILNAAPGRASQQNAGASEARNAWLWFLHADSQLTEASLPALSTFIAGDATKLGYFDLAFLDDGPMLMSVNAFGAWLRSHLLDMPFGDQGLVMPRNVFLKLGSFEQTLTCGEDHELVWRARRGGIPIRPVHAVLLTSARRYAERGWWATTRWSIGETWRQACRFSRKKATR